MRRISSFLWIVLTTAPVADAAPPPTAADYRAAGRQLEPHVTELVKNAGVEPHWLAGGFWYRRDGEQGDEYVVFDLESRQRRPAFDHARINQALGETLEADDVSLDTLTAVSLSDDLATLSATKDGQLVTCALASATCEVSPVPQTEPGLLTSPDGRHAVFSRRDDLYLRDLTNAEETRLTWDGKPYFSYGKWPDLMFMTIAFKKSGIRLPPFATTWSPDGRFVLVPRVDERLVETVPFVEWVPTDGSRRPIVHTIREALAGESDDIETTWFVVDTAGPRRVAVDLDDALETDILGGAAVGWDLDRGRVFLLAGTFAGTEARLVSVDLETGKTTTVITEPAATTRITANTNIYNKANVEVVAGGERVIWYSDRTGWGHLYLYDTGISNQPDENKQADGDGSLDGSESAGGIARQRKAITAGEWTVLDILAVDEVRQEIYFTAGGREKGRDPYYRHLYKASIDPDMPTAVTLLTDVDADHHFEPMPVPLFAALFGGPPPPELIRPDLGVFLDTYSTVDQPPVTVLRSTADGQVLAELERADATALFATGYRPPERRSFKAADGSSDIYSVYYAPQRELPRRRHPVIDAVYGGPQIFVTPKSFLEACCARNPLGESALARLGFAVVVTDGRGTPGRSSAFRDAGYVEFTQVGIEDHVAAVKEWAKLRPEMDLERVGIYGWSWGGTFAAQAILSHPELYDVAVSGAGVYDYAAIYGGFEMMTGAPVYEDGSRYKTRPDENPANWEKLDITKMAGNLEGKLLLIYGDMDENVPQAQVMRLASALVDANKPYDLLYLPNRTHRAGGESYTVLRTWDYFVEHLLGAEPPRDVTIE